MGNDSNSDTISGFRFAVRAFVLRLGAVGAKPARDGCKTLWGWVQKIALVGAKRSSVGAAPSFRFVVDFQLRIVKPLSRKSLRDKGSSDQSSRKFYVEPRQPDFTLRHPVTKSTSALARFAHVWPVAGFGFELGNSSTTRVEPPCEATWGSCAQQEPQQFCGQISRPVVTTLNFNEGALCTPRLSSLSLLLEL